MQGFQFQSETRADFLESDALTLIVENVSMTTKEDEIALIVKSDDLTSMELRDRGEERNEESTDGVTESCSEIVRDEFGAMSGRSSMHVNFLSGFD